MSKPLSANQKAFNKVARHLLKQGRKSIMEGTVSICAYRGTNKTRCGIGALIPNRLYHKSIEGSTPYCDDVETILSSLGYKDISFNCSLQRIHDNNEPYNWKVALKEFAEEKGLVWPTSLDKIES